MLFENLLPIFLPFHTLRSQKCLPFTSHGPIFPCVCECAIDAHESNQNNDKTKHSSNHQLQSVRLILGIWAKNKIGEKNEFFLFLKYYTQQKIWCLCLCLRVCGAIKHRRCTQIRQIYWSRLDGSSLPCPTAWNINDCSVLLIILWCHTHLITSFWTHWVTLVSPCIHLKLSTGGVELFQLSLCM